MTPVYYTVDCCQLHNIFTFSQTIFNLHLWSTFRDETQSPLCIHCTWTMRKHRTKWLLLVLAKPQTKPLQNHNSWTRSINGVVSFCLLKVMFHLHMLHHNCTVFSIVKFNFWKYVMTHEITVLPLIILKLHPHEFLLSTSHATQCCQKHAK